ncbi:MAG: FHA domain-containing protein [Nannocystis sp.]|nr:FHA domain-containing protein [Nannocystis sp.]
MNATLDVRVLLHGEAVNNLRFDQSVIRIGRERDAEGAPNDIVLASKGVSRSHAQILVGDGGVTVIDRSRHGTFVNGERVQGPRRLAASDVIEIDAYTIQCELGSPDATRQAVPDPNTTAPELNLVPVRPRPRAHPSRWSTASSPPSTVRRAGVRPPASDAPISRARPRPPAASSPRACKSCLPERPGPSDSRASCAASARSTTSSTMSTSPPSASAAPRRSRSAAVSPGARGGPLLLRRSGSRRDRAVDRPEPR